MKMFTLQVMLFAAVTTGIACSVGLTDQAGLRENTPQVQPVLPYCELANHPEKYSGQTVRVNAILYFMMHGYSFMDKTCPGDEKQTAVLFNGTEHEAKLAKAAGVEEYIPWNFPRIIARGKFRRVTPSRKSDSVGENAPLIFEMEVIEEVVEYKTNLPELNEDK